MFIFNDFIIDYAIFLDMGMKCTIKLKKNSVETLVRYHI